MPCNGRTVLLVMAWCKVLRHLGCLWVVNIMQQHWGLTVSGLALRQQACLSHLLIIACSRRMSAAATSSSRCISRRALRDELITQWKLVPRRHCWIWCCVR